MIKSHFDIFTYIVSDQQQICTNLLCIFNVVCLKTGKPVKPYCCVLKWVLDANPYVGVHSCKLNQ